MCAEEVHFALVVFYPCLHSSDKTVPFLLHSLNSVDWFVIQDDYHPFNSLKMTAINIQMHKWVGS